MITQEDFRNVLRRRAGSVVIVTLRVGDTLHGLTVMDYCSVSMEPPLMLICIGNDLRSHAMLDQGRCFAINLLAHDQQALSDHFAGRVPGVVDRLAGLEYTTAVTGAPLLAACYAWLDCTLVNAVPAGDHTIYVGEVLAGKVEHAGWPLLYYDGDYRALKG